MSKNTVEVDLRILLVDDEPIILDSVGKILREVGYEVLCADRGDEGLQLFQEEEIDIVITDIRMPGMDGLQLLRQLGEQPQDVEVIIITGHGDMDTAIEALKAGSFDFLMKPIKRKELLACLQRTRRYQEMRREKERIQQRLELMQRGGEESPEVHAILGESRAMQHVMQQVHRVAGVERTTVLIQGESGTGKELIARAIHQQSARASNPFIGINCTAIPENLLESELFGHERGAFTDAQSQKKGLFELAAGGTLFLDEIGEMSLSAQAKILRVFEERQMRRVGGDGEIPVNARLISATNQDLQARVEAKEFRQDLFFRLNIFTIELPPLRERGDDVLLLAYHFLQQYTGEFCKDISSISPAAQAFLKEYRFPGNIRELRNLIERGVILCDGTELQAGDLGDRLEERGEGIEERHFTLAEVEKRTILAALHLANGNKAQAARDLDIEVGALRRRMRKYGIEE